MGLILYTTDVRYVLWLIRYLKLKTLASLNRKRLVAFQRYFNEQGIDIDVYRAIKFALGTIKYLKGAGYYQVLFDNHKMYPRTNIRLIDIVKLVNYGSLSLRGYPFLVSVIDDISNHPEVYHDMYLKERGLIYSVRKFI